MAEVKYLADINLNDNQLLHVVLQHLTGTNPTGVEGKIFYHSGDNVIKFHNGTDWISLSSATGDVTGVGAGVGLSGTDLDGPVPTLTVDFSEFSTVVPTNGDFFATLDADGTTEQKTSIAALAELLAGSGLTHSNSVISVGTLNQNTTGQAGTVVTNANLTGKITSVGNATSLGSFTVAELNTALSNGSINSQTTVSGSSGTVTSIGNLTGDVTSSNRTTTIPSDTVTYAKMQNVSATNKILGRVTSSAGDVEELSAANVKTILSLSNVQDKSSSTIRGEIVSSNIPNNTANTTGNAGTATKITSITNTDIVQLDDTQTLTNKTIAISQVTELSGLTAHMGTQLEAIGGSTTISADQWGYLGAATGAITNTNTGADITAGTLKTKLGGAFGSNALTIGDANALVTIGKDLTVTGDLIVSGATTTINTATLDVTDLNITVGKLATSSSAANGSGLTFGAWSSGTTPTLIWDHSNSRFAMNKSLATNIVGNASGSAGTVTSIGNLTGHITSTNRGTVLGSFTVEQLSAALSNASISGDNTGDQTTVSGSSGTVTNIGSMNAGDVTSGGTNNRTLSIGSGKVTMAKLANVATNTIIGRTADGTGVPKAMSATEVRAVLGVEANSTADQDKSDIEGLAIQTVGAITSGSWTSTDIAVLHGGTGASSASAARTNLGVAYATDDQALAGELDTVVLTPGNLAARSYRAAIGGATAIAVTHSLGTKDVMVQMYDASSFETVIAQVVRNSTSQVTVTFNTAPSAGDIIILVTKID
tara:strand:+ start:4143 stop:6443 length:2301 start_codon:yes stop_codon:yes gene_type:complete